MKLFIWLIFAAFGLFCLTAFVISGWILHDQSHRGFELPAFTALVFRWPFWLFVAPAPWLGYALVLSRRPDISTASALRYAGSAALALAVVIYIVAIASLLPYTLLKS